MEPVTHLLTGACLARAGFNRKAAYATLAMTLAAEAPDLDTLWSIGGPVAGFEHHRGWTHTLLGLPVDAALVLALVYGIHRVRMGRAARRAETAATGSDLATGSDPTTVRVMRPLTAAPVRWGVLYGLVLVALLSHLALDWTNNYGVRPFFPFNPRWYAGSFVLIVEPVMLLLLAVGLAAPALFGLIGSEVGARRQPFRARGFAVFALTAIAGVWGFRYAQRENALRLASRYDYGAGIEVLRTTASPYPVNPWRWHTVVETPEFYQLSTTDTLGATVTTTAANDVVAKPPTTLATLLAKRTWLGRVYLDWGSWAVVTDTGLVTPIASEPYAAVTFRDLRFMYDVPLLEGRRTPPLSGAVYVDLTQPEGQRVRGMEMDGRPQR